MYELNVIYFFPFIIALYFFHIQNEESRENLFNFLNDLTEYFVFNDDLFTDENQENQENQDEEKEKKKEKEEKQDIIHIKEEPIKYEEKYMENFYQNNDNNDVDLSLEEEIEKDIYFQDEKSNLDNKIKEINDQLEFWYNEKLNSKESDLEDCKKEIQKNITLFEKKKEEFNLSINKLEEQAVKFVLTKRLEKLKNSFIMEKTPLGNVVMYYNANRESFEYYSDSTIPYRFLEVIARKYVITFKCRFIYVMMEEELKKYEKKMELQEIQKQKNQEEQMRMNTLLGNTKKNVFATFKSYNKESGSGRVVKAPPPKNSIPNNNKMYSKNKNDKIILKENANRYTYEGRFSNFCPLKKIERKQVDKKYSISFSEFKKLHLQL